MSETELLAAISDMMDKKLDQKLDQKLAPIYTRLDSMEARLDKVEARLDSVDQRLGIRKPDADLMVDFSAMMDEKFEAKLAPIYSRFDHIDAQIDALDKDVNELKDDMRIVKLDLSDLKDGQAKLDYRMKNLEIVYENNLSKRLNTIESCYMDTFKRYAASTEKMKDVFLDIPMMKTAISQHAEILQKIS